jgi:hypothetical protein
MQEASQKDHKGEGSAEKETQGSGEPSTLERSALKVPSAYGMKY